MPLQLQSKFRFTSSPLLYDHHDSSIPRSKDKHLAKGRVNCIGITAMGWDCFFGCSISNRMLMQLQKKQNLGWICWVIRDMAATWRCLFNVSIWQMPCVNPSRYWVYSWCFYRKKVQQLGRGHNYANTNIATYLVDGAYLPPSGWNSIGCYNLKRRTVPFSALWRQYNITSAHFCWGE